MILKEVVKLVVFWLVSWKLVLWCLRKFGWDFMIRVILILRFVLVMIDYDSIFF